MLGTGQAKAVAFVTTPGVAGSSPCFKDWQEAPFDGGPTHSSLGRGNVRVQSFKPKGPLLSVFPSLR